MYSSVAQLRLNIVLVDTNRLDDPSVIDRIKHSDDDIGMDLGKYVNFALVPMGGYADANFPVWLNHLSQYKTCAHVLKKLYGAKRTVDDVTDIQDWEKQYDKLLQGIKTNRIEAVLVDGTNISKGQYNIKVGKSNIDPALGVGKYGEFENESDLSKDRPRTP
jgi:hypothetical protein